MLPGATRQTDLALQEFFQEHFANHGFGEWMEKQLTSRFAQNQASCSEKLQQLLDAEQEANEDERKALLDFMMADKQRPADG